MMVNLSSSFPLRGVVGVMVVVVGEGDVFEVITCSGRSSVCVAVHYKIRGL